MNDPTALQSIVGSTDQAENLLEDVQNLPETDENGIPIDQWELRFAIDPEDVDVIIEELQEMVEDDE